MTSTTAAVYYDPYDYEIDAAVHPVWKRLRDEAPVYRNEKYGFYALSRYEHVLPAMLDTATFSSAHGIVLEEMTEDEFPVPLVIMMDPPRHTVLRKLVSRAFTPRAIANLEDRVRRLCREMLGPFEGAASFDYVDSFGALLPPSVILALLGFPEELAAEFRVSVDTGMHIEEGDGAVRSTEETAERYGGGPAGLHAVLAEVVEDRRRAPRDDLVSAVLHAEVEDLDGTRRRVRDEEFYGFVSLLSGAGTETVARLLGWTAVILACNPDERQLLVDDPGLIPGAVEELLRYEAPSPINSRWVTRDVEMHGTVIPEGAKVALLNGSANRDERHFADPDRFDVRRVIDRHLSFGYGAHYCIGAALARLEGRIALEETLKRFPRWEIDDAELRWVHTSTVRGFERVPIHLPL